MKDELQWSWEYTKYKEKEKKKKRLVLEQAPILSRKTHNIENKFGIQKMKQTDKTHILDGYSLGAGSDW